MSLTEISLESLVATSDADTRVVPKGVSVELILNGFSSNMDKISLASAEDGVSGKVSTRVMDKKVFYAMSLVGLSEGSLGFIPLEKLTPHFLIFF